MPELADMRVQAEAHPVADPATDDNLQSSVACFPFDVLPSVADTGWERAVTGMRRHVVTRVPAMAADALRQGADTDARPHDRAGGSDRGAGGGGVAHHHRARSDEPVVRRPGRARRRAGRSWLHGVRGPGRPGRRGDCRSADALLIPLEPPPRGGACGRQLDARRVHADTRGRRADASSRGRKRPRAARLARRGERALCRRAPGRLGRVPGSPRHVARETPTGMTAQTDDELWSAIADPSRRRVLDLLVSNGDVSASWLAGHVPFSRQAVSKHLVVLERAGLISRRKQGREVLYQVEADRLDQATRAMAELAAQWDRRLGTIKRLAETAHAENKKRKQ